MENEIEIERKYKVMGKKDLLERLMSLKNIGSFKLGKPEERIIIDKYFDTPDKQLLKDNIAVRIRSDNRGYRFLQLKVRQNKKDGTFKRKESHGEKTEDFKEILDFLKNSGYIEEVDVSENMRASLLNSGLEMILDLHNERNSKKIIIDGKVIGKMELDMVEFEGGKFNEVELENAPDEDGEMTDFIELFEDKFKDEVKVCTDKK
ncbi:MAG: CYTH domain-containing protein, partial [Candidatus Aenigmatarchaeota archaeon]